jgi:RNA polymerase sigma factor (sigma-70 family)
MQGSPPGTLEAALAGDQTAWNRIVEDHIRLLWWIARSYRLDDATSADMVQTVWLQLVRFGHRIEDPARLPGWLATTARREAIRLTSQRELPDEAIGEDQDLLAPAIDERILDQEAIGLVLAAFERLPSDDQRILKLFIEVPPKSYQEIAALLGKSHGYIGPTRRRALDRLRALLREAGWT